MLERNKEVKQEVSAKIMIEGKTKIKYRRGELEKLIKKLEEIKESEVIKDPKDFEGIKKAISEKVEATMLLSCLLTGKKVILTNGEILLFTDKDLKGRISPDWIIKENPELCGVLAELMIF